MTQKYFKVAAQWWSNSIKNADSGIQWNQKLDTFEERLAKLISEEVEEKGEILLSTDENGSRDMLKAIASTAGIENSAFSKKTGMLVKKETAEISVTVWVPQIIYSTESN